MMATAWAMARATRVAGNKEVDGEGSKSDGNSDKDGNGNGKETGNGDGKEGEQIMVTIAALNTCAIY